MKFEIISKYADASLNLPVRKTAKSAGYDFEVAEDIIVPSYLSLMNELAAFQITSEFCDDEFLTLEQVAKLTKESYCKPTLVPTGIRCQMPEDIYLELSVRSSCPLKHWLILANGVGIIDADYYNADNEGHIMFQIINLSPFDILLKKGDTIGQGTFKHYYTTDDDTATGERTGGFGSTTLSTEEKQRVYLGEWVRCPEGINVTKETEYPTPLEKFQDECVMACNPNRYAFFVGSPKNNDPDQLTMRGPND